MPAFASADKYEVELCTTPPAGATVSDGIRFESDGNPVPMFTRGCGGRNEIVQGTPGGQVQLGDETRWFLASPENTFIHTLKLSRRLAHTRASFLDWNLSNGQRTLESFRDDGRVLLNDSTQTFTVDSRVVVGRLLCLTQLCPGGTLQIGAFSVTLTNLVAELQDEEAPIVAAPVLLGGGAARGTVGVAVSVTDPGSGIDRIDLLVDGEKQSTFHDDNGGRCQKPYKFMAPCPLNLSGSIGLDTAPLSEGEHMLKVTAVDASGASASSGEVRFVVRNAPVNRAVPLVAGSALVGAELAADPGGWEGEPTFSYQWLRCTAAGSACAPIAGAVGPRYRATAADLGRGLAVAVTGTNARGSASATSLATAPIQRGATRDEKAPALKRVSLSRQRVRLSLNGSSSAGETQLRLSSSEGGKLTIVVSKARKRGRPKHVITLVAQIKAGTSVVPLGPTLAGRQLAAGAYLITSTVRDAAGNLSKPVHKSLTILPG